MLIVKSQSMDVYRNLAIEELLMEWGSEGNPILFLWQSECAVVMGKNQNPWKECRLDWMHDEDVPLARRISGGGTVYHDAGNLNYCVVVDRRAYEEEQAYEMVFRALERFGIRAEKTGKSNLSVDGLKFSGNAFCFRKGRAMHHGTLLLNTDLARLNRYLGSMLNGIETHAIASVPATVTNLNLEHDALVAALTERFCAEYGDGGAPEVWSDSDLDEAVLADLRAHQLTDDWRYGATPRFEVKLSGACLRVVKGLVAESDRKDWLGLPFAELAFSASS